MKQTSQETHNSSMISMWSRHESRIQPWVVCHGCQAWMVLLRKDKCLDLTGKRKTRGLNAYVVPGIMALLGIAWHQWTEFFEPFQLNWNITRLVLVSQETSHWDTWHPLFFSLSPRAGRSSADWFSSLRLSELVNFCDSSMWWGHFSVAISTLQIE